jgi:hypothetical protein
MIWNPAELTREETWGKFDELSKPIQRKVEA